MSDNIEKLAGIRTQLANERTFLSCMRTQLALIGAGVALIQIFDHILYVILGWALCLAGGFIFVVGLRNYIRVRRIVSELASLDPKELGLD